MIPFQITHSYTPTHPLTHRTPRATHIHMYAITRLPFDIKAHESKAQLVLALRRFRCGHSSMLICKS